MFDHLTSFLSSREMISWVEIELPTAPFNLGISPLSSCSLGSSQTPNFNYDNITFNKPIVKENLSKRE